MLIPAQPVYVHSASSRRQLFIDCRPAPASVYFFCELVFTLLEFGGNMQVEIGLARLIGAKGSTWGGLNMAPSQAEKSGWSCSS